METVLSVLGTRPEVIKMAPVIKELQRQGERVCSLVCVTGQHRQMVDQMLEFFDIEAQFDLDLMRSDQSLSGITSALLTSLDGILEETGPDWVVAQGDTSTVMATAMACYFRRVRFGHVEAGLRTGDRHSPFPEEINRCFADLVADLMFVPTKRARRALLEEDAEPGDVYLTGNTVVDAVQQTAQRHYDWDHGPLAAVPTDKRLILVTAHRRESFGKPLRQMCLAVRELADRFFKDHVHFVYPVHPNPQVRRPAFDLLDDRPNITLTEPLDYLSLVHLMKRSTLVLTDSGGLQEEAPTFGVPVLVMRGKTERPEGIQAGVARLVGTDRDRIVSEVSRLLNDEEARQAMSAPVNPYGDGQAAQRIVRILLDAEEPT